MSARGPKLSYSKDLGLFSSVIHILCSVTNHIKLLAMQKCTVPLICAHLYEQIKSYTNTAKTHLDVKSNICLKLVDSTLKLFATV